MYTRKWICVSLAWYLWQKCQKYISSQYSKTLPTLYVRNKAIVRFFHRNSSSTPAHPLNSERPSSIINNHEWVRCNSKWNLCRKNEENTRVWSKDRDCRCLQVANHRRHRRSWKLIERRGKERERQATGWREKREKQRARSRWRKAVAAGLVLSRVYVVHRESHRLDNSLIAL